MVLQRNRDDPARPRRTLEVPAFADDGGEEARWPGLLIDATGEPRRVGLVLGNEFRITNGGEKHLYLAPSKLRTCASAPSLIVDADFRTRADDTDFAEMEKQSGRGPLQPANGICRTLWRASSITISNTRPTAGPRRPRPLFRRRRLQLRAASSVGRRRDGDRTSGFGRPLRNPIRIEGGQQSVVSVPGL